MFDVENNTLISLTTRTFVVKSTWTPTNTNTLTPTLKTQVRMRRESAEKTLLQSSEKISRNLREKFTTLSTRFATRMKATYRMKPLPPFVLAQGSRLRERFGQSNENWIQYSESRLKWYGKILFDWKHAETHVRI